jgi:hypothetical protein
MYFADIIELLTKKKRLSPSNPREWVLLLGDASMALPLDRTVESLMGAADLALVRRSWAESHGLVSRGKEGEMRGGNPNSKHLRLQVVAMVAGRLNVLVDDSVSFDLQTHVRTSWTTPRRATRLHLDLQEIPGPAQDAYRQTRANPCH